MIQEKELRRIAEARLKDATALLDAKSMMGPHTFVDMQSSLPSKHAFAKR